jgi:hypothetical protein
VEPAGEHQVGDHPQVIVQSDGKALAYPPELADFLPLYIGDGRFGGSQEKRAGDSNSLQSTADDSRLERAQVRVDIG